MSWSRDEMCNIIAEKFIQDGMYVNLGIGMPTYIPNYIPSDKNIIFQSENGMLGMGPYPTTSNEIDPDLINAGKETITQLPGSSYFSSAESFAMICGGHIDLTILGALEVSSLGDIASWAIPGKLIKGMGGAMDLVAGAKKVIVMMNHTNRSGKSKILDKCTMPLTGKNCVDIIVTELAIFEIRSNSLMLIDHPSDVSIDEIYSKTIANFQVAAMG